MPTPPRAARGSVQLHLIRNHRIASFTNALQQLYVAYFDRPADVNGLAYWEGVVESQGGNTAAVAAAFAASAEYKATYAGVENMLIVNTTYLNLFGHDADLAGLNYWSDLLDGHRMSIDHAVMQIAGGARGTDAGAFHAKVTAATAYTAAIDTPLEVRSYETAAGAAIGRGFLHDVTVDNLAATLANIDHAVAAWWVWTARLGRHPTRTPAHATITPTTRATSRTRSPRPCPCCQTSRPP